jgi:hypothetical protein
MNRLMTNVACWLALTAIAMAQQSADNFVLQGRAALEAKDIITANARFAAAVALAPSHQTANALYAATRLLSLPYTPPAQDLMDRLGVALTNRDIYAWTARLPVDTNNIFVPPNDFYFGELVDFARTNLLPQVTGALGNLGKITDPYFILSLTSNETKIAAVTVDYADIQMLKAILQVGQLLANTVSGYDFQVKLNAIYRLVYDERLTVERTLVELPQIGALATTRYFEPSKLALRSAIQDYLVASELIRARLANVMRLFTWDPEMAEAEARFRQTLLEVRESLERPVQFALLTNLSVRPTIHLGRIYQEAFSPRNLLPEIVGDGFVLGSLPDPTFNGLLGEVESGWVEEIIANELPMDAIPKLVRLRFEADGTATLISFALPRRSYGLVMSQDLNVWNEVAISLAPGYQVAFPITVATTGPPSFYRVVDLSSYPSVDGVLRDARTLLPIAGAQVVASSADFRNGVTDKEGRFLLVSRSRRGDPPGPFKLTFSAAGYESLTIQGAYYDGPNLHGLQPYAVPVETARLVHVFAGPITNSANGHRYYLLTQSNWLDAESEARRLGGNLVTIDDAAENAWVFSTFASYGGINRALWIGLNDREEEGSFRWSSGAPATFTHWQQGEPNGGTAENAVHLGPPNQGSIEAFWNDMDEHATSLGSGPATIRLNGVVEMPPGPG